MAFPIVESTAPTGRTAAETTSPVTYPATVSANVLIVCIARCAVAGAIGWPAGWTELVEGSSDASDDITAIAYKTAVGDEDGTTFNVTHGSGKSSYIVYSITGAANPATQAPQLSTVVIGTSTTPDPTSLTPTGGAKDYLWLWLGAWEGEQTSPPAGNPTNYSSPLGANTGIGGAIATNCRVASAQRNLNAVSEDPPSWTISVSDDWSAWTMAVHPAVAQTYFQSLPATAIGVGVLATISTRYLTLPAVATGVATLATVKLFALALAAVAIGVAALSRIPTYVQTLAATATGVAVLSRVATFYRTLAATSAGVATLSKGMFKTLAATAVGVPGVAPVYTAVRSLVAAAVGVAALAAVKIEGAAATVANCSRWFMRGM